MKYSWCLSLLFVSLLPYGSSILTKMACSVSKQGTCLDPYCFITPVNETVNAASFGCGQITRPLDKIVIRQKFYFKLFNEFIAFDFFPDIEFCSFYKNADKGSFFYSILKTLNQKVPGLIHSCPYQGKDLQINNLVLGASDLALWITGEYKIVYTFFDDLDNRILRVSAMGVIKRK